MSKSRNVLLGRTRSLPTAIRLAFCWIGVSTPSLLAQTTWDADQALAFWQSAVDQVWSCDVELTMDHMSRSDASDELQMVVSYLLRYRFSNGMWRIDQICQTPGPNAPIEDTTTAPEGMDAIAWDGDVVRSFSSETNFAQTLSFSDVNVAHTRGPLYHEFFRGTFYGEPYTNVFSPRDIRNGVDDRTIQVDASPTDQLLTYAGSRIVATLSISANGVPMRIWISSNRDVDQPSFEFENSLHEFQEGIWLPVEGRQLVYARTSDNQRYVVGKREIHVNKNRSFVNIDIEPAIFKFAFPEGAIVYDKTQHENYLVGKDGLKDYEGFNRMIAERVKRHSAPNRPAPETGSFRAVMMVVAFLIVGLICVFRYWKGTWFAKS